MNDEPLLPFPDALASPPGRFSVAGDAPEQKTSWADYERDHEAWQAQYDALREQIVGPADTERSRKFSAKSEAFDAVMTYHVINLRDLGEKIEIIAQDYDGLDIP